MIVDNEQNGVYDCKNNHKRCQVKRHGSLVMQETTDFLLDTLQSKTQAGVTISAVLREPSPLHLNAQTAAETDMNHLIIKTLAQKFGFTQKVMYFP